MDEKEIERFWEWLGHNYGACEVADLPSIHKLLMDWEVDGKPGGPAPSGSDE
jgi:hypothetical protein